jgi:hypothetical protein
MTEKRFAAQVLQTLLLLLLLTPSETVDVFRGIWYSYGPFEVSHVCGVSFWMWKTEVPYQKIEILLLFNIFT